MVDFRLDGAHPAYRPLIERMIGDLLERYPAALLRTVRIYDPPEGDRSMGYTKKGMISLNAHWFGRDPAVLRDEALTRPAVLLQGRRVAWHGGMIEEPDHLLAHEFGHVLSDALPGWRDFAGAARRVASRNPGMAVSGYGLVDDDEYWAECFAAFELGIARDEIAIGVRCLLDGT